MFDVVVDDGADFDRCSNRGANRDHLLSVVCRGGVTCKSQSKIGFRLHVLVVYRWKNEWRGEKYAEQEWLLGELFYGGGAAAEDMEVWAVCFARIPMSSLSLHLRG